MITELIFDWAEKTPERTAIVYNGQRWSYRSFARAIAKARRYFARRGYVGPDYAVLAVYNLKDFWILSLALRSLGLTTIVIRSAAALDQLGLPDVRCVVTSAVESWPKLKGVCATRGLNLLSVSLGDESDFERDVSAALHPSGGHIVRTSGTTGTEKMVLMTSAIDSVSTRRKVEVASINQDTVLCVFGISASSAVGYRWAASPWTVGGTTLIEQGSSQYQALLRAGITHAVINPAMLAIVLAAPADAFPRNDGMRLTVTGGPLTKTEVDRTKARITPHLFNLLASTESGDVAFTPLDTPEDCRWHRLVPGRVVEIVDESDRPVPTGEIGRVRVSTVGGPAGYLHDETATRTFFKDGFFYPGDLAAVRSDGRLALQGRLTDVINVRGHKISPAPIEDRLTEIFGVSGVCLFSMQDDSGEEIIHIVVESQTPIKSEKVIAALSQQLRGFSRAHVHRVAVMPRNEMGKVLRQTVRAQAIAGLAAQK